MSCQFCHGETWRLPSGELCTKCLTFVATPGRELKETYRHKQPTYVTPPEIVKMIEKDGA